MNFLKTLLRRGPGRIALELFRVAKGLTPEYEPRILKVKPSLSPWESKAWLDYVRDGTVQAKMNHDLPVHNASIMELVKAVDGAVNRGLDSISVIDIGGGMGIYYPYIGALIRKVGQRSYAVVDSSENIKVGRQLFEGDSDVTFFSHDDEWIKDLKVPRQGDSSQTILNLSGTLQYILDWREFLQFAVGELVPDTVVVTRHPVYIDCDREAYCLQNVITPRGFCGQTYVVLFRPGDLEEKMADLGYSLESRSIGYVPDSFSTGASDRRYVQIRMQCLTFRALTLRS